jgi:hypothetical protein
VDSGAGEDRVWLTNGRLWYVLAVLGAGDDAFRLGSAWADYLRVRPGAGADSVTVNQSTLEGFTMVLVDVRDLLGLDRLTFLTEAELAGTGRAKVRFPSAGTVLETNPNHPQDDVPFAPTDTAQQLLDKLVPFLVRASWPKIGAIEFDPFWNP